MSDILSVFLPQFLLVLLGGLIRGWITPEAWAGINRLGGITRSAGPKKPCISLRPALSLFACPPRPPSLVSPAR